MCANGYDMESDFYGFKNEMIMIKKKDLLVLVASYEPRVTAKSLVYAKAYKEVCNDLLNLVKNCSISNVIRRDSVKCKLDKELEDLSWTLGVEKCDDVEVLRKYEKGKKLQDAMNDYISNGL